MQDFEDLDYYALLGVARDATQDQIKRAYRQQVTRYHPDRYTNATPDEQEYARERTLRLNEAYSVLGDFQARSAYNRGQHKQRPSRAMPVAYGGTAPTPRDHLAELYAQARAHLEAGRNLQAAATLRQLQQINPFYRDSAELLAQLDARPAGAAAPARPAPAAQVATPQGSTRRWLIGGIGGAALVGLLVAVISLRGQASSAPAGSAAGPLVVASASATSVVSTATQAAPTAAPSATLFVLPSTTSLPATATTPPSPTLPPPATASPPAPTAVAEAGTLVVADDFSSRSGWASVHEQGWSVGYGDDTYRISAEPGVGNIWSFSSVPGSSDYSLGADVQASGGSAGLLVRYESRGNYVACFIAPETGGYRVELRRGGRATILAEGASDTLAANPTAPARLVARVRGDTLTLLINGAITAEVNTTGLQPTRMYGMIAVGGSGPVEAQFDNLEVRELKDEG